MADLLSTTAAAKLPATVKFIEAQRPELPCLLDGKTIAIARDAAFCFIYPANIECLEMLGAKLAYFSPLSDSSLPDCDAVWLPGGYPELHGTTLAANSSLWNQLTAAVAAGKPVLAECGGMMTLFETLRDVEGNEFQMAGLLPGCVAMQKRLAGLGMQEVELPEGTVRGHAFHYSKTETGLVPLSTSTRPDGREGEAIYRHQRLTASYMHLYFPSNPEAVARLFLN